MNLFWKMKSSKLGKYNELELRTKLGLSAIELKRLFALESERYKYSIMRVHGKARGSEYYASRLAENPLVAKYGNTPIFQPEINKTPSYIFNEETGVYLEKTWSRRNKYNQNPDGQNLPFDFAFDPDRKL